MNLKAVSVIGESKAVVITDADGKNFLFDLTPYIVGDWYGELADPDYFKQVRIDKELDVLAWPNGQDVGPEDLDELAVPFEHFSNLVA